MPEATETPGFAALLRSHLERRGAIPEFAKRVNVDTSFVWHVLNERRKPPENMDLWADALGLTGAERERFIVEGGLTRCPEAIQKLVRQLWKPPA
jgi:hypothetical protein